MGDIVTLTSAKHSGSIRFVVPTPTIEALDLKVGDIIEFQITGIFKDKDQKKPDEPNFITPIKANIISAGGSSLGITIRRNFVNRYELEEGYDLIVDISLVKRISKKR